jgi:hypothetical protein
VEVISSKSSFAVELDLMDTEPELAVEQPTEFVEVISTKTSVAKATELIDAEPALAVEPTEEQVSTKKTSFVKASTESLASVLLGSPVQKPQVVERTEKKQGGN